MAERKKSVDAVIIGYGWTGAILAKTLTDAGLSVVALIRSCPGRPAASEVSCIAQFGALSSRTERFGTA